MDLKLEGRRCLVTGASAGIGAGVVEALLREGALVAATARRGQQLEALAQSMKDAGIARPVIAPGDVTDPDDVKRIAREASAFPAISQLKASRSTTSHRAASRASNWTASIPSTSAAHSLSASFPLDISESPQM